MCGGLSRNRVQSLSCRHLTQSWQEGLLTHFTPVAELPCFRLALAVAIPPRRPHLRFVRTGDCLQGFFRAQDEEREPRLDLGRLSIQRECTNPGLEQIRIDALHLSARPKVGRRPFWLRLVNDVPVEVVVPSQVTVRDVGTQDPAHLLRVQTGVTPGWRPSRNFAVDLLTLSNPESARGNCR